MIKAERANVIRRQSHVILAQRLPLINVYQEGFSIVAARNEPIALLEHDVAAIGGRRFLKRSLHLLRKPSPCEPR